MPLTNSINSGLAESSSHQKLRIDNPRFISLISHESFSITKGEYCYDKVDQYPILAEEGWQLAANPVIAFDVEVIHQPILSGLHFHPFYIVELPF